MTETQKVSRKSFHPLLVALFAGVVCWISYPILEWVIGNSYSDPQAVMSAEFKFKNLFEEGLFGIFGAAGAVIVFLILTGASGALTRKRRPIPRIAALVGTAVCFAVNASNVIWVGEEFDLFKRWFSIPTNFWIVFALLVLFAFVLWSVVSRWWTTWNVVVLGVRYAANSAMALLIIGIPAHIVAGERGGWFSGLGTFIAIYFSLQVLLVIGICGLWLRRSAPEMFLISEGMHAAAASYALRESVIVAAAAFFLLILSYAIYPLVSNDRFTVAMFGQVGFGVLATCAAARGIKGYLLRTSRPFWILGCYLLLAELAMVVAWKLVIPAVV